ncbi:EspG family protein [Actinopolyspora alba]|uniref:EspG family protein n=1 Tax=Actinopolyspora alba TaxID=673379 RepID=A0A1I1YNZ9_9ACTN|nr:ESX secretion-associated protein EspG [Actinopolyspora alba]SFE19690.1 EspG family protein [Actinopolyspora alba]
MAVSGRWQLHPLHLYFLHSYLGLDDLTLPLEVEPFTHTRQQFAEVGKREYETMRSEGLIVDDEVEPGLAHALAVLAKPYLWVDSMWLPRFGEHPMWRAVAAVTVGNRVVLGVQPPGETERYGGPLTVELHDRVSLSQALLPTLPPAPPGNQGPVRVPESSFPRQDSEADSESHGLLRPAAGSSGGGSGDRQLALYRALGAAEHLRAGQLAANVRDRNGRVTRSRVVRWFDNAEPDGRYLDHNERGNTGERVYALTPVDARALGGKIEELVAEIR